ncbi:leucine rich repeat (LRR) protein [Xylophilus ampelinus]|uniref:Leucine rich repeat (LRR) protein n=2 Tax=Xylophilus ampelinus TaxID=54067 RepID=A0A318SS62_9BURK|nr:leucine rich repeat (LRR) protein [Xylophilus ampelinus]
MNKVTSLSLAGNNLTSIDAAIFQLLKLKQLDISRNLLGGISGEIGQLQDLRALDASNAGIEWVPAQIGSLPKLENLDLSNNALDRLPSEIGNLSKLEVLKLNGNMLKNRPAACEIDESQQAGLPQEIGRLSKLRELDLSSNHFQSVPEEIGRLGNLQTLKFNHNALTDGLDSHAIPGSIAQLKNLGVLDLSDNPELASIPRDFGPLHYSSKKKLQIGRQQQANSPSAKILSKTLSLGRNKSEDQAPVPIAISVKNTAIPWTMFEAGRLPALSPADRPPPLQAKALYAPPNDAVGARGISRMQEPDERMVPHPLANAVPPGAMRPPAMLPVDGAQQPFTAYGDMQAFQWLMQRAAGAGGDVQQQPFSMPHSAELPVPERARSPDAQSDCSTDSFASASDMPFHETASAPVPGSGMTRPTNVMSASSSAANPAGGVQPRHGGTPSLPMPPTHAFPSHGAPPPYGPLVQRDPMPFAALQQPSQPYAPPHAAYRDGAPAGAAAPVRYPQQPQVTFPGSMPFGNMALQPFGAQATGFAGASALQNPLFAGLLSKIAAGVAPPPMGIQHSGGFGRDIRPAYSPQLVSPAQAMFERIGIASIQASRLKGLSESCSLELEGDLLNHRIGEALRSDSPGKNLWNIGLSIYRQKFINDRANDVAAINRDKKNNSPVPLAALLIDDPKQIALVYQTLVSNELGIPGFEAWRRKLDDGDEEYLGLFGRVVAPSDFDNVRRHLITDLFAQESQNYGLAVAEFVENQNFWKNFQRDVKKAEKFANQSRHDY